MTSRGEVLYTYYLVCNTYILVWSTVHGVVRGAGNPLVSVFKSKPPPSDLDPYVRHKISKVMNTYGGPVQRGHLLDISQSLTPRSLKWNQIRFYHRVHANA